MRMKTPLFVLIAAIISSSACRRAEAPDQSARKATTTPPVSSTIGDRILIAPNSLPAPFSSESATNPPTVVPAQAGVHPIAPEGFEVSVFAEGDFGNPRLMIEAANGDLFLTDSKEDKIYLLRDTNKDGRIDNASERFLFADKLTRPYGIAINGGYIYIANTNALMRAKYVAGETKLSSPLEKIADLPGTAEAKGHSTRNIIFNAAGTKLYVAAGSSSNVDVEDDPRRAAISEYNPDGTGHRIFASGIRNPVGLAINPVTKELWTCTNERDGLGDNLVPDYATSVKDGLFYGWPYYYIGKNVDPRRKDDLAKAKVPEPTVPDVLLEAHGAPLSIAFYTGTMFPKEYQGNVFVALHGSWNRSLRHGYKIVRIPMKDGKPEGGYINFMNGWLKNPADKEVWGRPAGLLMIKDGSLLVVDDTAKKVWRVAYKSTAK